MPASHWSAERIARDALSHCRNLALPTRPVLHSGRVACGCQIATPRPNLVAVGPVKTPTCRRARSSGAAAALGSQLYEQVASTQPKRRAVRSALACIVRHVIRMAFAPRSIVISTAHVGIYSAICIQELCAFTLKHLNEVLLTLACNILICNVQLLYCGLAFQLYQPFHQ